MHMLNLPAGSKIRLNATTVPDRPTHRWNVRVLSADMPETSAPRLSYSSQIGGRDCEQRIEIPAQDIDCRLEVSSQRETPAGWEDDRCRTGEDTPSHLLLGFSTPASTAETDEVMLSFTFDLPRRPQSAGA